MERIIFKMKGAAEMEEQFETIKQSIIAKVLNEDHVSFIEVERIFEEHCFAYQGDKVIHHSKYPHVLFWGGWNKQAIDILAIILEENKICLQPSNYLNYLIDGDMPEIPVANIAKDYKTDHWMPMLLKSES